MMAKNNNYCKRYALRIACVFVSLLLLTVAAFYPAVIIRSHYVVGGPHGTEDVAVVDEYSGWWYRCQLETNTTQQQLLASGEETGVSNETSLFTSVEETEGSYESSLFTGWFNDGRVGSFWCESITTTTFIKYHREDLETDTTMLMSEFLTSRSMFIGGLVFTCTSLLLHIVVVIVRPGAIVIVPFVTMATTASVMFWLSMIILYLNIELIHPAMDLGTTMWILLLLSIYHLTLVFKDVAVARRHHKHAEAKRGGHRRSRAKRAGKRRTEGDVKVDMTNTEEPQAQSLPLKPQ